MASKLIHSACLTIPPALWASWRGWRWCFAHERLCPASDWLAYGAAIREVVRIQWAERHLIRHWLDLVQATHRDAYTVEYLERRLRLGNWCPRDLETARKLELVNVEDVAA